MRGVPRLMIASMMVLIGCEEAPRSGALPRCEPPGELVLERGLKTGFRALSEGKPAAAKESFNAVLAVEPGHPEARAGLRASEKSPRHRAMESRHDGMVADGHDLATKRPVDHDTFRLETRTAERDAAKRLDRKTHARRDGFHARIKDGDGSLAGIDLVVLHATGTMTALEHFVVQQTGDETMHFLIDWDGTVYQTLDLNHAAHHTGDDALDARSIAVALVNPIAQDSPPLPSDAVGVERTMSPRLRVQGKLFRSWGYTAPQMASLHSLLGDLTRTLPDLNGTLPGGTTVPWAALPAAQRETVRGVVGELHLDPTSREPGPGFDWSALRATLK